MKKLIIYSIVSFTLFLAAIGFHAYQQSKQESFTYTITQNDSQGIYGTTNDNTGVFITKADLNKLSKSELKTGDQIKVAFADYETIVKVEKVN